MEEFIADGVKAAVGNICKELINAALRGDHPLTRCTTQVQKLIQQGGRHGERGEYEQAIECFSRAAELDPKYIGSQLRLIKAYKHTGHHAKALFAGGIAIKMSSAPKIRCQLFDMMGQISKELFEQSPTVAHLDDAIEFYHSAILEDDDDLLPRWNLLCAYLSGWQCQFVDEVTRRGWENKAKGICNEIVIFAGNNRGETQEYIGNLLADAHSRFPAGDWWNSKLRDLEEISVRLNWAEKPQGRLVESNLSLRKALLVSVMALAITTGWPSAAGGASLVPVPTDQSVAMESEPRVASDGRIRDTVGNGPPVHVFEVRDQGDKKSLDLVEIERDWQKLAEIERDWTKLA